MAEHIRVEDGTVLVLVCADGEDCPDAGKMFYGDPDELRQAQIVAVGGSCAGELIHFELDDIEHRLTLDDQTGTLEIEERSLRVSATDSRDVSNYTFYCDPNVTVPDWVDRFRC